MKLACILRTYKTCNSTVGFSKYEFNNKLLGGVTFFRVSLGVTWIQTYMSQFNLNFGKSTVRLHYLHIFFMFKKYKINKKLIDMPLINCLNSRFCSVK